MSNKRLKAAKAAKIQKDKMPCNKPRRDVKGGKKSVVKACSGGKEKIVRFGDANMSIKKMIRQGVKASGLVINATKRKIK